MGRLNHIHIVGSVPDSQSDFIEIIFDHSHDLRFLFRRNSAANNAFAVWRDFNKLFFKFNIFCDMQQGISFYNNALSFLLGNTVIKRTH